MKSLSYAAALVALLAAGSAAAGEGSYGENMFPGADARQPAVSASQAQAVPFGVSGDRAVDPIYFNLSAQIPVHAASQAASQQAQHDVADNAAVDLSLTYAN